MDIVRLDIAEVMLLRPRRFSDARGFFIETYNTAVMAKAAGIGDTFVQDNLVYSGAAGTVRGLHYQAPPHAQAKLVTVITGRILDVAVDVRRGSPTYGRHVAAELGDDGSQIYIPEGFLHGYVTLQPETRVAYKVTDIYAPACEGAVLWNDPDLGVDWGVGDGAILSDKDVVAPRFADFTSPFAYAGVGA